MCEQPRPLVKGRLHAGLQLLGVAEGLFGGFQVPLSTIDDPQGLMCLPVVRLQADSFLKFFRSPVQVPLPGQDQAEVEMAGSVLGVDPNNRFKLLPGLFAVALVAQQDAKIVVRVHVVRIRLKSEPVLSHSAIQLLLLL